MSEVRDVEEIDLRAHVAACAVRYQTLFETLRAIKRLMWLAVGTATSGVAGVLWTLVEILVHLRELQQLPSGL